MLFCAPCLISQTGNLWYLRCFQARHNKFGCGIMHRVRWPAVWSAGWRVEGHLCCCSFFPAWLLAKILTKIPLLLSASSLLNRFNVFNFFNFFNFFCSILFCHILHLFIKPPPPSQLFTLSAPFSFSSSSHCSFASLSNGVLPAFVYFSNSNQFHAFIGFPLFPLDLSYHSLLLIRKSKHSRSKPQS